MDSHLKRYAVQRTDPERRIGQHGQLAAGSVGPPLGAASFVRNDEEYLCVSSVEVGHAGTQLAGWTQADRSAIAVDEDEDNRLLSTEVGQGPRFTSGIFECEVGRRMTESGRPDRFCIDVGQLLDNVILQRDIS